MMCSGERRAIVRAGVVVLAALLAGCLTSCADGAATGVQPPSMAAAPPMPGSCPATRPAVDTTNLPDAAKEAVPFVPDDALLCRYGSDSPTANPKPVLTGSARLSTKAASLATQIDRAVSEMPSSGSIIACPLDTNETFVGYFAHGQQRIEVVVGLTGCEEIFNGAMTNKWVLRSRLASELQSVAS